MTMHERIMSGKLFTDICEGMPAERLKAKKLMKRFNDSEPDDIEGRVKLMGEIFGKPCKVIREINEHDMEFYYRDRRIDPEDLEEERKLRENP